MNVFSSQTGDAPEPGRRSNDSSDKWSEHPDNQLQAEFQARPATPSLRILNVLARLDPDLSACATSLGLPLIVPANCKSHPVDWQELQAIREQLHITNYNLDTVLISPLLRISSAPETNKMPGWISTEQLAAAVAKVFTLEKIHDFDGIKAQLVAHAQSVKSEAPFDCMVVLGVAPDADAPLELNKIGISRMQAALSLFHSGFVAPLVLVGGSVTSPDELPEAKMMLQFLSQVLPPSLPQSSQMIHLEPHSRSTEENFILLADVLAKENFKRPLVVTSDYHVQRARTIADRLCGETFQFSFFGASSIQIPLQQRQALIKSEAIQLQYLRENSQ